MGAAGSATSSVLSQGGPPLFGTASCSDLPPARFSVRADSSVLQINTLRGSPYTTDREISPPTLSSQAAGEQLAPRQGPGRPRPPHTVRWPFLPRLRLQPPRKGPSERGPPRHAQVSSRNRKTTPQGAGASWQPPSPVHPQPSPGRILKQKGCEDAGPGLGELR